MNAFDKLVDFAVHKELRQFQPILKEAKLFQFGRTIGYRVNEHTDCIATQAVVYEGNEYTNDRLMLPFPITAISMNDYAAVFTDKGNGIYGYFVYAEVALKPGVKCDLIMHGILNITKCITVGGLAGRIDGLYTSSARGFDVVNERDNLSFLQFVAAPLKAITDINVIDRFILEVTPTNLKTYKDKYVPKADQRPSYILLFPKEVRKYMGTEHEVAGQRSGHERRAHLRTYPNDAARFPNAHGKTIKIASTWIGSTEKVVGNKKYRVILDYYQSK